MYLFVLILVLTFLLSFVEIIVKLLQIRKLHKKADDVRIVDELRKARENLQNIIENPNPELYSQTIRKSRAQKLVNNWMNELSKHNQNIEMQRDFFEALVVYSITALVYFALLIISIRNRYEPVMVLNDRFNLKPFEGLISFPTGIHNAISVPIWIWTCRSTLRLFDQFIKPKNYSSSIIMKAVSFFADRMNISV